MTPSEAVEVILKEQNCEACDNKGVCPVGECRKCPYFVRDKDSVIANNMAIEALCKVRDLSQTDTDETIFELEMLKKICANTYADELELMALSEAIEAVKSQRWIPVSEKLPEQKRYVLTTVDLYNDPNNLNVFILHRIDGSWADDGFKIYPDKSVLAWKPLPEPYNEVKE